MSIDKIEGKKTNRINSLSGLNRVSKETVTRGDSFFVDPLSLKEEDGFNVRDYEELTEHIEGFVQSYIDGKYVPPIVVIVRAGEIIVRDGHCRRLALLEAINNRGAEIKRVQVIQFTGDEIDQSVLVLNSNDGKPLSQIEKSLIYLRLARWGLSVAEIAKKVNKTEPHVKQLLALQDLPVEIKGMIKNDEISATFASECLNEYGNDAVQVIKEAKKEAAEKGKTKVTKSTVKKSPRLKKEMVSKMQSSLLSIYQHTKEMELLSDNDDDEALITVELTLAELQEIKAIGEKLEQLKQFENQQQESFFSEIDTEQD